MAVRVQQLLYGLSANKQTNISTVAASFLRFRKNNMDVHTSTFGTETDEDEIGNGNEFATQTFPTAWDVSNPRISKFGSAEFMTWALAYGLGGVAYATGIYTITPLDPATTIELPYASVCQQAAEGGGMAIDEVYLGCAVEEVSIRYKYGPGRASVSCDVAFMGSGLVTKPSGITLPAVQTEHYILSSGMTAITLNGTDYIAGKSALGGTFSWKNNLMANTGYFPGSGVTTNGISGALPAAARGRLEFGKRVCELSFTARLLHASPEYQALVAQTTGTATITFTYDSTHTVSLAFAKVAYRAVNVGNDNGLMTVEVTVTPEFSSSLMTVTAQCGIATIAQ